MLTTTQPAETEEKESNVVNVRPEFHSVCTGMNVIDFTLRKLSRIARAARDEQHKETLRVMINDYSSGVIAIAWKCGKILWKKIDTND